MGRVPQAPRQWRGDHRTVRLDRGQWRPGQFLFLKRLPRRQAWRQQPDEVVQRRVRRVAGEGPHPDEAGRSGETLFAHAGDRDDEAPELLLAHSIVFEAMRSNVTGYKQSPLGTHAFEGVDIK